MLKTKYLNPPDIILTFRQKLFLLVFIFIFSILFFSYVKPQSADWHDYFLQPSRNPLNPYTVRGFMNPPWTAILLYPIGILPYPLSAVLNSSLAIVVFSALVLYRDGSLGSLILTITSVPIFFLSGQGNIDWLPALGFFFANGWGIILLLTKPQNGLFAVVDWFYNQEKKARMISIPVIFILISFFIWRNWPLDWYHNVIINTGKAQYNRSIFPWFVPIGLGLLYYLFTKRPRNGELLGVLATFCLSPYYTTNSLAILYTLISIRYPKISIILWGILWVLFFIAYT